MPVVPKFTIEQEDDFIVLKIHVPYIRISDLQYTIDGKSFSFYIKPYLLRLNFPEPLVDDERATATYEPTDNNGTVTVRIPKEEPGLVFEDLDLLTKLKQPKISTRVNAKSHTR